jgi:hypothetical protein
VLGQRCRPSARDLVEGLRGIVAAFLPDQFSDLQQLSFGSGVINRVIRDGRSALLLPSPEHAGILQDGIAGIAGLR